MSFRHDSRGVKSEANFTLAAEGWYPFKIMGADEMRSSKGNDMILVKARIINDDRYPDTEIWHYVTFLPPDNKGAGISVQFRSCIGVAHGGDDIVDSEDWVGKRFMGYVVQETYEGNTRNKISKVSPMKKALPPLEEPREPEPSPVEKLRRKAVGAGISAGSDSDIPF